LKNENKIGFSQNCWSTQAAIISAKAFYIVRPFPDLKVGATKKRTDFFVKAIQ
jgi:hypothetical protein